MGMLTEVDNMVLEIIGKESPVICGLQVAESFEKPVQSCETVLEGDSEGTVNKSRPVSDHVTPSTSKEANGKPPCKKKVLGVYFFFHNRYKPQKPL